MIVTNITSRGASMTNSLSGSLSINESNGEIVIRSGSTEVLRLDKTGFKYFDNNGITRISMGTNTSGQQQIIIYGADGKAQILVGQDPKNGTPVIAVSDNGKDVLTELVNA